jgi:RHS repeat-associated protein
MQADAETGFYITPYRYYDPHTGRWISQDPVTFAAGDANVYRYVHNNSVNRIDPAGLAEIELTGQREGRDRAFKFDLGESRGMLSIDKGTGENAFVGTLDVNLAGLISDKDGLLIRYEGKNFDRVRFIQFVRLSVTVTEEVYRLNPVRDCWEAPKTYSRSIERRFPHSNPRHMPEMTSSTPDAPIWYLDTEKGAASPYYSGASGFDTAKETAWMWDQPLENWSIAKKFENALERARDPLGLGVPGLAAPGDVSVRVTQLFVTYVVAGSDVVGLIFWSASSVGSVTGRGPWGTGKDEVTISGPKISVLGVVRPWPSKELRRLDDDGVPYPDIKPELEKRFGPDQTFVKWAS